VEAFDLLKRVLRELKAFAPQTIDEDTVRERMRQIAGRTDDPVFNRPRFGRLLRQANDASIVDLSKTEKGFLVTLRAEAGVPAEAVAVGPLKEEAPRGRGRRGGRGRGRGREAEAPAAPVHEAPVTEPPAATKAASPAPAAPPVPSVTVSRSPILRWGRGAKPRGDGKAGIPLVGVVEIADVIEEKKSAPRKPRPRGGAVRRGGARGKKKGTPPEA
jgi:hypothetical protein